MQMHNIKNFYRNVFIMCYVGNNKYNVTYNNNITCTLSTNSNNIHDGQRIQSNYKSKIINLISSIIELIPF